MDIQSFILNVLRIKLHSGDVEAITGKTVIMTIIPLLFKIQQPIKKLTDKLSQPLSKCYAVN